MVLFMQFISDRVKGYSESISQFFCRESDAVAWRDEVYATRTPDLTALLNLGGLFGADKFNEEIASLGCKG